MKRLLRCHVNLSMSTGCQPWPDRPTLAGRHRFLCKWLMKTNLFSLHLRFTFSNGSNISCETPLKKGPKPWNSNSPTWKNCYLLCSSLCIAIKLIYEHLRTFNCSLCWWSIVAFQNMVNYSYIISANTVSGPFYKLKILGFFSVRWTNPNWTRWISTSFTTSGSRTYSFTTWKPSRSRTEHKNSCIFHRDEFFILNFRWSMSCQSWPGCGSTPKRRSCTARPRTSPSSVQWFSITFPWIHRYERIFS